MKSMTPFRVTLCLATLVAVSALAGLLAGRRLARVEQAHQDNPESWNQAAMRTFERTVKPTDEQRTKIKAHLDAAVAELKSIRSETISRSTNVIWRLVAEVERDLTPEQRKDFEAMKPRTSELQTLDILQVDGAKK